MRSLGLRFQWPLAFHLWLSHTCLSTSMEGHKWQLAHSPLVFTRAKSFVMWVPQGSQCSITAFPWERSFVSLAFPWFGFSPFYLCYVILTFLECPHGIQPRSFPEGLVQLAPPYPAPTSCWWLRAFSRFSAGNHYSVWFLCWFFFFFGYAALWDSKAPHWPHLWEGFLLCRNFSSFTTPSPAGVSVPKSFVSLFVFILCSTSFWRDWFSFLGIWDPPSAFRNCSVGVAPHSDHSLMFLWGRKWSPYPILLLSWEHPPKVLSIILLKTFKFKKKKTQ